MNCTKCGKEIENGSTLCETCGESTTPPKKKLSKKLIAIIAVVVAAVILVVALASGGDDSDFVIESDNETGAVFNLSMDDLTDKINKACDDIGEYTGQGENAFDISSFWNNMVEPQVDIDESGKEFTLHTAFLDGAIVSATVQDEKISTVRSTFEYNEYEIGDYFGMVAIMSCSGLGVEEAGKILDTITNGNADGNNTMIYKDSILYSMTSIGDSKVAWTVMAVSEDFVKSLEESGSCEVLRW